MSGRSVNEAGLRGARDDALRPRRAGSPTASGEDAARLDRREQPRIAPSPFHGRANLAGWAGILGIALCHFALAGCGYTVGSPYKAEIRSVYVPIFTSSSNRRWLEFQLTESVQKQIQSRTHFRLADEGEADTKLTGRIIDGTKRTLGMTGNSDPRELQINLMVQVTWEDTRTGEILRQERVPISAESLQLAAQSEFAPEVGQSLASGTREVVDRLARNIVDMMEAPW